MTPDAMRAESKISDTELEHALWAIAAEICERLDLSNQLKRDKLTLAVARMKGLDDD